MREKRFSVRALVLTVVLTVLLTAVLLAGILCLLLGKEGMSMAQAMVLINTQFVGEHDIGEAVDGAMDSLITGLGDRWSYYMDAEGYARQKENKSNAYVGLGCTVSYPETEGLLIEAVTEDGPADKAGLKAGDLILEIDGVRMEGEARSRATEYTRGPDGSEAELLIQRADGIEQRFKVVRARVEEHPVSYERLDDGTGVVTIRNFNSRCAEEAVAAVEELEAQGVERLVFDVRNNGGGYLDELTTLLDYLLPEGTIFRSGIRPGIRAASSPTPHVWTSLWRCWSMEIPIRRRNSLPLSSRRWSGGSLWGRRPLEKGFPSRPFRSSQAARSTSPRPNTLPERAFHS